MPHLCSAPKANQTKVSPPWMLPQQTDFLLTVSAPQVLSQSGTRAPLRFELLLSLTVGPREKPRAGANLLTLLGGKGKKRIQFTKSETRIPACKNQSLKTCTAEGPSQEVRRMGKPLASPSFFPQCTLHLLQPQLTLGSALALSPGCQVRAPRRPLVLPLPRLMALASRARHSPEPRHLPAGLALEVGSRAWPWAAPWSTGGRRSEPRDDLGRRVRHGRRHPLRPGSGGGSWLPASRGLCRREARLSDPRRGGAGGGAGEGGGDGGGGR